MGQHKTGRSAYLGNSIRGKGDLKSAPSGAPMGTRNLETRASNSDESHRAITARSFNISSTAAIAVSTSSSVL